MVDLDIRPKKPASMPPEGLFESDLRKSFFMDIILLNAPISGLNLHYQNIDQRRRNTPKGNVPPPFCVSNLIQMNGGRKPCQDIS